MKRNPEAVAWDLYADANPEAFNTATLGSDRENNRYLRNRIERAFRAGIEFQKHRYKKAKGKR